MKISKYYSTQCLTTYQAVLECSDDAEKTLANVLDLLIEKKIINAHELSKILGYEFTVEEDT